VVRTVLHLEDDPVIGGAGDRLRRADLGRREGDKGRLAAFEGADRRVEAWKFGHRWSPISYVLIDGSGSLSAGCVSKLRQPSGKLTQGCLLRIKKCTVACSPDVSSSVPARTRRSMSGAAV